MLKIRYRKIDEKDTERKAFGGHVHVPHHGMAPYTPEPAYIVEVVCTFEGETEALSIAMIEREKMSGSGNCNMWGSRYRWCVATNVNLAKKSTEPRKTYRIYDDTLADA